MKKAIVLLILLVMLGITGCRSDDTIVKKTDWQRSKYFVVKDGQLGLLTLPEKKFLPFHIKIWVENIIGIKGQNTLLVLGKPQDSKTSSGYFQIYQINIDNKSLVSLANNIEQAFLSPDRKKIIYTTFNQASKEGQSRLFYMYLDLDKKPMLISQDLIDRPWWDKDSNHIAYTIISNKIPRIMVYDLKSAKNEEVPIEAGNSPIATGWLGDDEIIARNKDNDFLLYDLKTNHKPGQRLFNHNDAEAIYDIKGKFMLVSVTSFDSKSPKKILNIISRSDLKSKTKIVEVPLFNQDYGYHSAVSFKGRFISDKYVFYRVLTAENDDPIAAGIVDIRTKAEIELDKKFMDMWSSTL